MKIVQVSTYDITGGAARAAFRLHTGLRQLGQDSVMFVARRRSDAAHITTFRPEMGRLNSLRRRIHHKYIRWQYQAYAASRPESVEFFSDDRSEYDGASVAAQLPLSDVIHLHWVAGFVDYRRFVSQLPSHKPLVWTLHDMNVFTGGCHYDQDCGRFKEQCGSCPQLGSPSENDLSRQIWRRKQAALNGLKNVHFVTSSQWMVRQARQSKLLENFEISVIPYGLDIQLFTPRDQDLARRALEIPLTAKVILFVADSMADKRKGFSLLVQALSGLNVDDLFLLSVGNNKPILSCAVPHLHLGFVEHSRLLALIYSAADIFVIPSQQEAFGQTALEAIACGTPVVGFEVGGIPDMIRPGMTGFLAKQGDVADLRRAMACLLQDSTMRELMAKQCRLVAEAEYGLTVQAQQYIDLYARLIARYANGNS